MSAALTIDGVVLASEVTEIPRCDLIAEIVRAETLCEAERVEHLLALGCETCEGPATTIMVMEDLDWTMHICCYEHRPRWGGPRERGTDCCEAGMAASPGPCPWHAKKARRLTP